MIAGYCKAEFDEFSWRDAAGIVLFAGRSPTSGRHRDRVWAALSRYKRVRRPKRRLRTPSRVARVSRAIKRAAHLSVLRRWDPCHPLDAWHTQQSDDSALEL
jgi:hypothetical protein